MAKKLILSVTNGINLTLRNYCQPPKHLLQLHPFEIPSLKEKLKNYETHDELLDRVNIGLPYDTKVPKKVYNERLTIMHNNKINTELEESSRLLKLKLDLNKVEHEWLATIGPDNMLKLADHYNIYKDLFDLAYFYPLINMNIYYPQNIMSDEETFIPVFRGNMLQANEAVSCPIVEYDSEPNHYWSILLTSLDSHLTQANGEYLHWFIANIPGNDITTGDVICEYLQPFPTHGSGYHRMVFVLYQQTKKINFDEEKRKSSCLSLRQRTFSTLEFYRKYQTEITPAGLNFFQAIWDPSLHNFFHNTLKMREPYFTIETPARHKANQRTFPVHKRFDTYLDCHKDPRDVAKEVILLKLKSRSPFLPPQPRPKYPNFDRLQGHLSTTSTWQREDLTKRRMGWGKYRYLYDDEAS